MIFQIFILYFVFFLFGFIGLPFVKKIIISKPLAFIVAKPIGLLLFGYAIWLLSYLHILNYQNHLLILILFLICVAAGLFFSKDFFKNINFQEKNSWFKKLLFAEGFAFLTYLAYLFLRSYNGAINGTERFMDMALLSASGKTNYFPFIDPWYAGHTVNYYYYGSYLESLISNLARVPYNVSYNLALGLIYSQSALLSAVLAYSFTKSKKLAFLAAFLITTAGTLFYAGCSFKAALAEVTGTCSYASSTRLYSPSYIINEIASYSFTVGDLHAHLQALPLFLLCLILFYALSEQKKFTYIFVLLLAISIASSGMTNAWDLITLSCFFISLIIIKLFFIWKEKTEVKKNVFIWLSRTAMVAMLTAFFLYPALKDFHNPVLGLGFIPLYVKQYSLQNVQWPTPLLALLGMWGIFFVSVFAVLFTRAKEFLKNYFLLSALVLSAGIILGVELFFIRDIYSIANPPYFRANTTFKFGYHAWTMLCLVFVFCIYLLQINFVKTKILNTAKFAKWLIVISVAAGIFYPYQAIKQFYLSTKDENISSLDGSKWMQTENKTDLAAVEYINKNIKNREVIAEAVGDSYTTYARISTFTGNIAPMGWQTHEWTWRFDGEAAKKAKPKEQVETGWGTVSKVGVDMQKLYETKDLVESKEIINSYGITYIYVGKLEKEKYLNLFESKFYELGELAFEFEGSRLFKVKIN